MGHLVIKEAQPGDLLSEYDTIDDRFLGRYIILKNLPQCFEAYCLYDITGFFSQGSTVIINHTEIENTLRYTWTIESNEV